MPEGGYVTPTEENDAFYQENIRRILGYIKSSSTYVRAIGTGSFGLWVHRAYVAQGGQSYVTQAPQGHVVVESNMRLSENVPLTPIGTASFVGTFTKSTRAFNWVSPRTNGPMRVWLTQVRVGVRKPYLPTVMSLLALAQDLSQRAHVAMLLYAHTEKRIWVAPVYKAYYFIQKLKHVTKDGELRLYQIPRLYLQVHPSLAKLGSRKPYNLDLQVLVPTSELKVIENAQP